MKFLTKTILAGIGSMVIQLVYSDEAVVKEILPSEVESAKPSEKEVRIGLAKAR